MTRGDHLDFDVSATGPKQFSQLYGLLGGDNRIDGAAGDKNTAAE